MQCCQLKRIPVITYTGKELTKDENMKLKKYSESIIIKGAKSPERLLEGRVPGEFLSELSKVSAYSLPEMDHMIRKLIGAGKIVLSEGRVLLHPEEI